MFPRGRVRVMSHYLMLIDRLIHIINRVLLSHHITGTPTCIIASLHHRTIMKSANESPSRVVFSCIIMVQPEVSKQCGG